MVPRAAGAILLTVFFVACMAGELRAQAVGGAIVDEATGAPLDGAMVVLLAADGAVVGRVLTSGSGSYRLDAERVGPHQIRVDRIGFESLTTEMFQVPAGGVYRRVEMPMRPIRLTGVDVDVSPRCDLGTELGLATGRVWEEARKALAAAAWTLESGVYRYTLLKYDRWLDELGSRVLDEERVLVRGSAQAPYSGISPDALAERGYITAEDDQSWTYWLPDAEALTSDEFLATHCIRLGEEDNGELGLEFEPVRDRDVPEIRGTMWLDAETARLRRVEFRYVNRPARLNRGRAEGQIVFGAMPNGTWVIREWSVQMPEITLLTARGVAGYDVQLNGYKVRGGTLQEAAMPSGLVVFDAEGTRVGTVVDSAGVPVGGETVRVEELAQLTEELYASACAGGDYFACNAFGLMFETGQGVEQNLDRARDLYRTACEGGLMVGCANLGLLYSRGVGTEQDVERARGQFEVACEGGDPLGCELLAVRATAEESNRDRELFTRAGQIGDGVTGGMLSDAVVELPDVPARAISDEEGRVAFERLPAGEYDVRVKRLGYLDFEATVEVPGNEDFLVLLEPMERQDPTEPGAIIGLVTADGSGGLSDVDISVVGQSAAQAISGGQGRFTLRDLAPGLLEVRFTRLGYTPRTATLVVQPGRTAELEVVMPTDAIELDPIEVNIRPASLERAGFYQRRNRGFGRFYDRRDLERLFPTYVSDVVRRTPGIDVSDPNQNSITGGAYATSRRVWSRTLGPCLLPVYVDGVRMADSDINQVPPLEVEAIEVYRGGNTPVEFGGLNPCGVIVIWTNR